MNTQPSKPDDGNARAPIGKTYNAFLSYSHAADNQLAPALQDALQAFARPFYRMRALRIFRDESSLQLTPALWPAIQRVLRDSEFFILLGSPDAARSAWVRNEITEWLDIQNGSIEKFFIVLTEGELGWDEKRRDFDWARTDALPRNLEGRFENMPLYLDLRWARKSTDLSLRHPRFLKDVATLAATIHRESLDNLIGRHVEQYRLFRRVATGTVALLLTLTLITTVAAVRASRAAQREREARQAETDARLREQRAREDERRAAASERLARGQAEAKRREAERQQQISLARSLVAQAQRIQGEPALLERSVLLAAEAVGRLADLGLVNVEADEALRYGLALLPQHVREISSALPESDSSSDEPIALVWSRDGERLVAASRSFGVRAWSLDTGKKLADIEAGKNGEVALSPDGEVFVRAHLETDKTVFEILEIGSSELARRFELAGEVHDFSVSVGGNHLAARVDEEWVLWHLSDSREVARSSGPVAFSPTGESLAMDGRLMRPSGSILENLEGEFLGFSADGQSLVVLQEREYAVKGPKQEPANLVESPGEDFLALSARGRYLATLFGLSQVLVREVSSGREAALIERPDGFRAVAFSPEGENLAAVTYGGDIVVWRVAPDESLPRLLEEPGGTTLKGAFIDADEQGYLFLEEFIWRDVPYTSSFSVLTVLRQDFQGDREPARLVEASAELYTVSADGRIVALDLNLFDVVQGRELAPIDTPNELSGFDHIVIVALSPDGRFMAAASRNGKGGVWEVRNGRWVGHFFCRGRPERLAVGRDGIVSVIATAKPAPPWDDWYEDVEEPREENPELIVRVWNPRQGRELESFVLGTRKEVSPYDLSPDGRLLATTKDRVEVRELPGGRTIVKLFYDSITDLKFDREGRRLALVEWGGSVRVLEVADGRELARIRHLGEATALSFSPSGKYLSILNDQGAVQASPLQPGDLLAAACARVSRNLKQEEWEHYLGANIPFRKTCRAIP